MEEVSYIGTIRFEQKDQIEKIRSAYSHELSSHAFVSLYLWQKALGLTLHLSERFFTAKCSARGKNVWFFPCGDDSLKKKFITQHIQEEDFSLCYLGDRDKVFLETYYEGCFEISEEDSSSEYIYDRKEYETICGGRFSNMRKQINRLKKEHKVEVEELCDENRKLIMPILENGFSGSNKEEKDMPKSAHAAKQVLRYWKELGVFGLLVFVDDTVQSLALGFPLTEDTIDGCIECSNMSIHGLSYFSKRALFLSSNEQYRYMNAEEDLGLPGLRMVKRHMAPIRQNRIFYAVRNCQEILRRSL